MNLSKFMQPSVSMPCTRQASRLHSIVQIACRQRAGPAALALLVRQRVRLALDRSMAPGGQAKSEGKIKGPAHARPQSQSARGFGAARHLMVLVPCRNARPHACRVCSVLSLIERAVLRWSSRHGQA